MICNNSTYVRLQLSCVFLILAIFSPVRMAAGQNVEEPPVKLTKCGDFKTENPTLGTLAADKEKIFLGTADGNLQAFDQNLLSPAWHTELGGEIASNITIYDGGVLVVSNVSKAAEAPAESVLRSISKETGVPNWTAKLPYSEHFFLGVTGPSITAIAIDGRIANIDLKTGHIRWQNTGSGRITARPFFFGKGSRIWNCGKTDCRKSGRDWGDAFKARHGIYPDRSRVG